MIDFLDDHLLLAFHEELFFASLHEYISDDPDKINESDKVSKNGNCVTVTLSEDEIKSI